MYTDSHHGRLSPSSRRRLFLHEDGFVLCFFAEVLERRGLLRAFAAGAQLTVGDLATTAACSRGYLHIMLRTFAQAGWLARTGVVGTDELAYAVTPLGQRHLSHLGTFVRVGAFLHRHIPIAKMLFATTATVDSTELARLIELAVDDWGTLPSDDADVAERIRLNLAGALLTIVMLGLWEVDHSMDVLTECDSPVARDVRRLLGHVGWLDVPRRCWTVEGDEARSHTLHFGLAGSYVPLLRRLPELLYPSDAADAQGSGDGQVDRHLNILASAHAHQRYFEDADDIFLDIFDREPVAQQPAFVADTGCGDGTWLRRIYELIRDRTRRGRQLRECPLLMVGIDYSMLSANVAQQLLADANVPSVILQGDISDPDALAKELGLRGLAMESGLHVRAFLDHNRLFDAGLAHSPGPIPSSRSSGAYLDGRGEVIPNRLLEREMVPFLERWIPYVRQHGMVVLEAHCVDPSIGGRHVGQLHNVVFDAYHALSRQYPVDFNVFMEAAQLAGLRPLLHHQRRYPSHLPFVAISTNRFVVGTAVWPLPVADEPAGERAPDAASAGASYARPHELASDEAQARPEWRPAGTERPEDGEGLHRLLYDDGDTASPRAWAAAATGVLVRRTLERIGQVLVDIESGRRAPVLSIMDYGCGSGMFAIELLKAMDEAGLHRRLGELGGRFELDLVDIPSSWFAKGYQLLHGWPSARFYGLRGPTGRFVRLRDLLPGTYDAIVASMVFHLVPRRARPVMFSDLAGVLRPDGVLLWSAPDIGRAPHGSVEFHEPFRRLRRRGLELLDDPSALAAIAERLPASERGMCRDLVDALERARASLTAESRAAAARLAEGQILPKATDVSTIEQEMAAVFEGAVDSRSFEMRPSESLDAILVPSNQRVLAEIADDSARQALIELLLRHEILPDLMAGPPATADGYSVHWTYGTHRLRA